MSEKEKHTSSSPSNYDLLYEEFPSIDEQRYLDRDQRESSRSNSPDTESFPSVEQGSLDKYATSPPATNRQLKRESEKRRHHTVSFAHHAAFLKRGPTRDQSRPDPEQLNELYYGLEEGSPDTKAFSPISPTSATVKKSDFAKRGKNTTKTRSYDRELKRRASDLGTLSLDSSFKLVNLNSSLNLKVDSPNKFKCLQSQPVTISEHRSTFPVHNAFAEKAIGILKQSDSYSAQDCPAERIEFHKTFSALISLHNKPEKKKKESEQTPVNLARQVSCEKELFQTEYADLIWLEIQSRVYEKSIQDYDAYLYKVRSVIPCVINELLCFSVQSNPSDSEGEFQRKPPWTNEYDGPKDTEPLDFGNLALVELRMRFVEKEQKDALLQVEVLLKKVEFIEGLYPTLKALQRSHPEYCSEAFQQRLNALNLWLNITTDITNKVSLMAHILYIQNMGIYWPWLGLTSNPVIERIGSSEFQLTLENVDENQAHPKFCLSPSESILNVNEAGSSDNSESTKHRDNVGISLSVIEPGTLIQSPAQIKDFACVAYGLSDTDDELRDVNALAKCTNAQCNDGLSDPEDTPFSAPMEGHFDEKFNYGLRDSEQELCGMNSDQSGKTKVNDGLCDSDSEHPPSVRQCEIKAPSDIRVNNSGDYSNAGVKFNDGLSDTESETKFNDGLSDTEDETTESTMVHKQNDGLSDSENEFPDAPKSGEDFKTRHHHVQKDTGDVPVAHLNSPHFCVGSAVDRNVAKETETSHAIQKNDCDNANDGLSDIDDGLSDSSNSSFVDCQEHPSLSNVEVGNTESLTGKHNDGLSSASSYDDLQQIEGHGVEADSVVEEPPPDAFTPNKSAASFAHSTPSSNSRILTALNNCRVRFHEPQGKKKEDNEQESATCQESNKVRKNIQAKRSSSKISFVSRSDSSYSFDPACRISMYRYFVDRNLKKMGMRKLMSRIKNLLHRSLKTARQALEYEYQHSRPSSEPASPVHDSTPVGSTTSLDGVAALHRSDTSQDQLSSSLLELNCESFASMNLPAFLPIYLFLLRIPLDVLHECLRLRLEQRYNYDPDLDPSVLSIRQLIRECKEVLLGGVMIKGYYQEMVGAVLPSRDQSTKDPDLQQYEEDLQRMLEVYFDYLRIYMSQLQSMCEMSKHLKNFLEDEWYFTKKVCPHISGGEASAGNHFCLMASSLLVSIRDFLASNFDTCLTQLYDSLSIDHTSQCDSDAQAPFAKRIGTRSGEIRKNLTTTCRSFKETFTEARERASKALGFAKLLLKDLEIAAEFNVQASSEDFFTRLKETAHIQVVAPHSADFQMFVPCRVRDNKSQVFQLLNACCGRDDVQRQDSTQHIDGYLLLVKCAQCGERCSHWQGEKVRVEPTADTTIALSHIKVEGLLLVVIHSSQLQQQRQEFTKLMRSSIGLLTEQTSCHQAIAESLTDLRNAAMELQSNVTSVIKEVDEQLNFESLSDIDRTDSSNIQALYRETLHLTYNFGFEFHKDLIRLISGQLRQELTAQIVDFAISWMNFVTKKCERGKGVKPRWAKPGLDYLCVACEPKITAWIEEEKFRELKSCMNKCIMHVIGERIHPCLSPGARPGSPLPERAGLSLSTAPRNYGRFPSHASSSSSGENTPQAVTSLGRKSSFVPMGSSVDLLAGGEDDGICFDIQGSEHTDITKFKPNNSSYLATRRRKVEDLEKALERKLHEENRIGCPTQKQQMVEVHISNRRVNFKWQRGIKLGEGQFGKVYTALNTNTGKLMAVKEIRFQPNDQQTIKDVAEEIKIFEELNHPGLVKYYGVEIHRDEMLIFMEYCADGTIEDVAKQGLGEGMVRKYTAEILQAVNYLHEQGIVHRDIKGANIFLTKAGPVKLGDFGSAVKLKNHTTMPGELRSVAGTTAFMAPEVIKNEKTGSGRASDIWSVACVVIEMTTGKRPWHELKNNFNIMYRVGTGGTPQIPESLSHEGKQFLERCLVHDPIERPTASDLLSYPFLKVSLDDDMMHSRTNTISLY